jgi:hypothetical protein
VELAPGRIYIVTTLPLYPGITIEGNGATFLRKAESVDKWSRLLNTIHPDGVRWKGSGDSPRTTIRRLILDGNRENQSIWKGGHDLEQAHLLFLSAHGSGGGRLQVLVEGCATVENVADGISVHSDVEAEIRNHYAENCFRGGITVLAGNSVTTVDGYTARGRDRSKAVDIEVQGKHRADVRFIRCRLEKGFQVSPGPGSVSEFRDVVLEQPPYYVTGWSANGSRTGRVIVRDSVLPGSPVKGGAGRASAAYNPTNVEFRNITFRIAKPPKSRARRFCGMLVQWHGRRRDQSLLLEDCRFEVARESFQGSEEVFGIFSNPVRKGEECRGKLLRVTFGEGLDWALHLEGGGEWLLEGVTSRARGLMRWKWLPERYLDLTLADVDHLGPGELLRNATGRSSRKNIIRRRSGGA